MRRMVEGVPGAASGPLRLASLATSPASRGRNRRAPPENSGEIQAGAAAGPQSRSNIPVR